MQRPEPARAPELALHHRHGYSSRLFYLHASQTPLGAPCIRGGERDADSAATITELRRNISTAERSIRSASLPQLPFAPATPALLGAATAAAETDAATAEPPPEGSRLAQLPKHLDAALGSPPAKAETPFERLEAFEARFGALERRRRASTKPTPRKLQGGPLATERRWREIEATRHLPPTARPLAPMIVRTPMVVLSPSATAHARPSLSSPSSSPPLSPALDSTAGYSVRHLMTLTSHAPLQTQAHHLTTSPLCQQTPARRARRHTPPSVSSSSLGTSSSLAYHAPAKAAADGGASTSPSLSRARNPLTPSPPHLPPPLTQAMNNASSPSSAPQEAIEGEAAGAGAGAGAAGGAAGGPEDFEEADLGFEGTGALRALLLPVAGRAAGDVTMLRASYLLELAASPGGYIRPREELPPEACVAPEALRRLLDEIDEWNAYLGSGRAVSWHSQLMRFPPIVILSCAWETLQHPDPAGERLRSVIAPALEWYLGERANLIKGGGASGVRIGNGALTLEGCDFGVYLDFASVAQQPCAAMGAAGAEEVEEGKGGEGGEVKEAEEEQRSSLSPFRLAHEATGLLCAHASTCVWQLPSPASDPLAMEHRGWPLFEACLSALPVKPPWLCLDLSSAEAAHLLRAYGGQPPKKVDELTGRSSRIPGDRRLSFYIDHAQSAIAFQRRRPPPMLPPAFVEQLNRRSLPSVSDRPLLIQLQRRACVGVLTRVASLDFSCLDWRAQEVRALAKALPLCRSLQSLSLAWNFLGPESTHVVCRIVAANHPTLTRLDLGYTALGSAGVHALCLALGRNDTLSDLRLRGCAMDDSAQRRLNGVAARREARRQARLAVTYDALGPPPPGGG